jgi:threonine dehydrogenase-like Zn-dependent dehydrogenase
VASTIACGSCAYCRDGYYSQCDQANPHGRQAGPAVFGGPKTSGSFDGLQAEFARIPFANIGLVKLPDQLTDDQAILLSDVFPTGYFAAELAEVEAGDVVAVFGCGGVGQFAIFSAFLQGAGRVLAVDNIPSRLEIARGQGAEVINFDECNPVHTLMEHTGGIGPDRVIDAVGICACAPHRDEELLLAEDELAWIERQRSQVSPAPWHDSVSGQVELSPVQVLDWAVASIAKAGTLAIIGVYPPHFESLPLGKAFQKNLTLKMGVCPHRRYMGKLLQLVASGSVDLSQIVPRAKTLRSAAQAYDAFERGEEAWLHTELVPG